MDVSRSVRLMGEHMGSSRYSSQAKKLKQGRQAMELSEG